MRIAVACLLSVLLAASTGLFASTQRSAAVERPRSANAQVRLSVNVYEVTGEALGTLKPMDLDGFNVLAAESRNTPGVPKDGVKLIASPSFTVSAGDSPIIPASRMSVGQMLYVNAEGNGFPVADGISAGQLREINIGVQLQARAWVDAPSQQILLETQLEVTDFEGFTELQVATADGGSKPVFIPIVKTFANNATRLLQSGETNILAWQEDFSGTQEEPQQKLIIVTIVPTLLP